MERIAKGDQSYCVTKECPIREHCARALENYIAGPDVVSSFFGKFSVNGNQVECETFVKLEDWL